MNQDQAEKQSFVSKNLAFGEKLIYSCKVHKGVWIIPLMTIIGCYAFIISYPDSESISSAWIIFALFFIFFLYTLWIYNGTEIILTNQRLIIKKSFGIDYIELQNIGILKCKDAITRHQENRGRTEFYEINSYEKEEKSHSLLFTSILGIFSSILDIVKVIIIDKNGVIYSTIDYIGLYNYKQLYKLYLAECEKRENLN